MKKTIILAMMIFAFSYTNAQRIGIGFDIHHMTHGLLFSYSPSKDEAKFKVTGGLRYIINHYSETRVNEQGYIFYKQGYADGFLQHLGFWVRPSFRILKYKFIEFGAMGNLTVAFHGRRSNIPIQYYDPVSNDLVSFDDISSYNASPSVDLLLGPFLLFAISKNVSIGIAASAGVTYMHHKHEGKLLKSGKTITLHGASVFQNRGHFEASGLERLPNLFFSASYRLGKN